jgi:hypothetical protein
LAQRAPGFTLSQRQIQMVPQQGRQLHRQTERVGREMCPLFPGTMKKKKMIGLSEFS